MLCHMAAFKAHCAFGFWKAKLMKTLAGAKKSDHAMGQYGRLTSLAELPSDATIVAQIKEAALLNANGVKMPKAKAKPKQAVKDSRLFQLGPERQS